jgi:hypothetical protein
MQASSGADGMLYALDDSGAVCSYAKELRISRDLALQVVDEDLVSSGRAICRETRFDGEITIAEVAGLGGPMAPSDSPRLDQRGWIAALIRGENQAMKQSDPFEKGTI